MGRAGVDRWGTPEGTPQHCQAQRGPQSELCQEPGTDAPPSLWGGAVGRPGGAPPLSWLDKLGCTPKGSGAGPALSEPGLPICTVVPRRSRGPVCSCSCLPLGLEASPAQKPLRPTNEVHEGGRCTRPSTRTWAAHTEAQPAFHSTVPCTGSPTAQNGCTETQGCRNACCTLSEPRVGSGPRDSVGGASGPLVFPSWAEGPRLCD